MLYTSYFAKIRKFPDNIIPISIARFQPKWLNNIIICDELSPTPEILELYKKNNNINDYIKKYDEEILSKYNSKDIIHLIENKTGIKNIVNNPNTHIALCCYEKPTDFCHRHLLADFLEKENIMIQELDDKTIEDMKNKSIELNPLKDGITHINIYSKAETELGRFLTNFAFCPINTDEGIFNSIEGYWGYLKINPDNKEREKLKELYGLKAKQKANEILKNQDVRYERIDFDDKINEAIRLKFNTYMARDIFIKHKDILNLPITHYYYFGNKDNCKIIDVTNKYPHFINSIKTNLKNWIKNNKDVLYKQNSIGLDINKTVCFTGRRPKYLFGYNDTKSYLKLMSYMYGIVKEIYNEGYRNFITGGAQGFDQLMFRVVNKLKKDNPNTDIKNILYLPCKEQSSKWGKEGLFGSDNYDKMLKAADCIYYVSDTYTNTCLMDRNRAMIDNSSLVIALYDDENWYNEKRLRNPSGTLNALNYAKSKHKNIYQVSFNEKDILNTLQFSEIFDFIKSTEPELKNNDNYLFGIKEGIVCQQVNCKGVMGAGLAKAISDKFPIVKEKYLENYKKNKGMQFGSFQIIDVAVTSSDFLAVCNLYTQDNYGNSSITKKCYTNKELLINDIDCVCSSNPNTRIYIPIKIGCGLAGGNWEEIKEDIINLVKKRNINNAYFLDTLEKKAFYIKQTGEIIQVPTDEELNKENPFKEDSYEKE